MLTVKFVTGDHEISREVGKPNFTKFSFGTTCYIKAKVKGVKQVFYLSLSLREGKWEINSCSNGRFRSLQINKNIEDFVKGKKFQKRLTRSFFAQKG